MKYPYRNNTYDKIIITKVQDGFNKEATFIINPPPGYTLTPVLNYKVEVLSQGAWVLGAIIYPDNPKYRFLPNRRYRVTTTFDSSMKVLVSNSFEVTPVSTYSEFDIDSLYPVPFNTSLQTIDPVLSNYTVQFTADLIYGNNSTSSTYIDPLSFAHQTINPILTEYNVQFVGELIYDDNSTNSTYVDPLTFAHQTTNPIYSTFSPQFVGAGGV